MVRKQPAQLLRVNAAELRDATQRIFAALGCNDGESARVAEHLVEANLRGHDSHGVGMIPVYVGNGLSGEMRVNHQPEIVLDTGGMLICDGGLGLGQTIAHDSIAMAIMRAKTHGSCILGLRNSHHIGRIGAWAEQCASAGLVSIHFVNVVSTPSVAPFGGTAPRVGTNPFAVGVPRKDADPVIVDFATSKMAVGKIRVASNMGVLVPDSVLLDGRGQPTNDPDTHFNSPKGAILSFGEHKGWALAFACEVLGAALTGGFTQKGPKLRNAVVNCMLSIVIDPERLGTRDSYFAEIEAFIAWTQTPPEGASPCVLLPGDPERMTKARRLVEGIPIDSVTWDQIVASAVTAGLRRETIAPLAQPA